MEPEPFFRASPHATLRQGDIFLAPAVRLWTQDSQPGENGAAQPQPALGASVFRTVWENESSLTPVAEVRRGVVMVVSHSCQIEKEFNQEVRRLIDGGVDEEAAVRQASDNPDLDRMVVVAPLRPLAEFPREDRPGIQNRQRIGYLMTDVIPRIDVELVADLTQLGTVERHMLTPEVKLASLAPPALGDLRYKLAETYALRGLSVLPEIEAMIGHTIVGAEATPKSRKKSTLVLKLDNGSTCTMEIKKPRDGLPDEILRQPATGGD